MPEQMADDFLSPAWERQCGFYCVFDDNEWLGKFGDVRSPDLTPLHSGSLRHVRQRFSLIGRMENLMKMHSAVIAMILCILEGCAGIDLPPARPAIVYGSVTTGQYTGWTRDYCGGGDIVPGEHVPVYQSCMSMGSEVKDAVVGNAQIVGGGRVARGTHTGFVSHGEASGDEKTGYMVLLPAPADFSAATGVHFIVGDRDNYDPEHDCLRDQGFSHLRSQACRDPDFHKRNAGRCIPSAEYLAHFAASGE